MNEIQNKISRRDFLQYAGGAAILAATYAIGRGIIKPEVLAKEPYTPYGVVHTEQYKDFFHQEFRQDIPHGPFNMWLGQASGVTVQPQEEPTIIVEGREVTHLWNTSFQKLAREKHKGAISTMALGLTGLNDGSLEVEVVRAESMEIDGQSNPGAHYTQFWRSQDGVEWVFDRYDTERATAPYREELLAMDQKLIEIMARA